MIAVRDRIDQFADPDRTAYDAFRVGRGIWWKVWGPKTIKKYVSLIRKGRTYQRHQSGSDTLQLGGDFVIGPDKHMTYVYRPPDPDSRPPVDDLVAALTTTDRPTQPEER